MIKGTKFISSKFSNFTDILEQIMNIDFNTKIVMRILMLKCNDSSLMNLWESIIEIIKNPKHNVFAGKENLWISSALKACWFLKSSPFDKSGFDNSDNDLSDGVFHILLSDEPELSLNDKRYLSKYNIVWVVHYSLIYQIMLTN